MTFSQEEFRYVPANQESMLLFTNKIVIVVRNDLAHWQELNVTAFLISGIIGAHPEIIGEPYIDQNGNK